MAEVNQTIVFDNGSGLMKAGFAGNTKPQLVFPAIVGRPKYLKCAGMGPGEDVFVGEKAAELRGLLKLTYPTRNGIIRNWQEMELLWNHVYGGLKGVKEHHPVLCTEAALNPRLNRERMAEIFFENFNAPAFFVATQALLALYTSGRTSGLVLDCGDGVSHVVPVVEGFALVHSIRRADAAGHHVTEYLQQLLRRTGHIFQSSAEFEIVREIKEATCYVNYNPVRDEYGLLDRVPGPRGGDRATQSNYQYQLPDGTQIQVGSERCRAPELLFNPAIVGREQPGLQQLVNASIEACELDLRRALSSQIVLSGGSTLFAGFIDRLLAELRKLQPKDTLIRVFAPPERQMATFIGGSILASLATFKKLWITKQAYDEEGPSIIFRKTL